MDHIGADGYAQLASQRQGDEVRDLKRRVAELERRLLQMERAIRIAAAALKDAGILKGAQDG